MVIFYSHVNVYQRLIFSHVPHTNRMIWWSACEPHQTMIFSVTVPGFTGKFAWVPCFWSLLLGYSRVRKLPRESEGYPGERCGAVCYCGTTSWVWSSQVSEGHSGSQDPDVFLLTCLVGFGNNLIVAFSIFPGAHGPLPSGKLTVCYWKWPSRNSGFSQL